MNLDRKQLRKLLLVALSSDQPGEVMAALGKVKSVLVKAGLDIHWLADTATATSSLPFTSIFDRPPRQRTYPPPMVEWREMLELCSTEGRLHLSRREKEFVESLLEQWATREQWHPTDRQLQWLGDIYTRLTRRSQA
jgi:hypothetical protein